MVEIDFRREKGGRRFAGRYFNREPVFIGDLVEYRKGNAAEIGEVQVRGGKYYVGGMEFNTLDGKILRIISMEKKE
jgi:hypothetical protein